MNDTTPSTCSVEVNALIEIWKVLEVLTVSLDRIGEYEVAHGEDHARAALTNYMGPAMYERIAQARARMLSLLQGCSPSMMDHLEEMAEDEAELGYWRGPE